MANQTKSQRNPRGSGRNTKLTPELIESISKCVMGGNYIETASAMNGIAKKTLYEWLKRGKSYIEFIDSGASLENCECKKEYLYADFVDAMQKAMAIAEARDVQNIDMAARSGAWQASAWRLERRNPRDWGRHRTESDASTDDELEPSRADKTSNSTVIRVTIENNNESDYSDDSL